MCFKEENDKIYLFIKVQAGQAKNEIYKIQNNKLIIKINAPRDKGKANKALIKYLAKILNLKQADIYLKSGEANPIKTLVISNAALSCMKEILKKLDK